MFPRNASVPEASSGRLFPQRLAFMVVALIALHSLPMLAQVTGATLSGTIKDVSGAVIPKAKISFKNVATGVDGDAATDTGGYYIAPNLLPGTYDVTAEAPGFATVLESGIVLTVGSVQLLDFTMRPGNVLETIKVEGDAQTIQLSTSSINAVIGATTIRELPINGRSWTDLAALQPGVGPIETQLDIFNGRGNRGLGGQVDISGARPQQNNYRLDGVSLNDYANGAPSSILGGSLGVDAIQEFSIFTTNYSAEYGRSSGGVINAVTRSGTNGFHGSAYEFIRNSALDARNFFDGPKIPPFKRNQFGGTFGGPIRKDHTFIFADYEGIRQSLGVTSVISVLSPAAHGVVNGTQTSTATLCSIPAGNNCQPSTVAIGPGALQYLSLYPLPNGPLNGNGDTGTFSVAEQQIVKENFFTLRVDHKFSDKDTVSGTYLIDRTPLSSPDVFNNVLTGFETRRTSLILEEGHTFSSTLANFVRFGFNRNFVNTNAGVKAIKPAAADPSLGAIAGENASTVKVPGLDDLPGGVGTDSAYFYRWNTFQGYDDAFFTTGLHSLKFGIAVERDQLNRRSHQGGNFHFNSILDFLSDNPQSFNDFITPQTENGLRQTIVGLYVQDDWRFRPNLTLNLGLRYEMSTVPTEVQGKLSNLYNITDPTPHLGNPYFLNPTLHNFEPRIGFAWDPFHNGKTAVRGGFGIYDSLPLSYLYILLVGLPSPFFERGTAINLPPGSFPRGAAALLTPTTFDGISIERASHRNYVMQWNFNVQRQVGGKTTALIGYVGSRGMHQPVHVDDANMVIPTLTSAGFVWPKPIGSGTVINPNFGDIGYLHWNGDSHYHALQASITRDASHGLQLQGSFTWSKSIDDGSAAIAGDTFANSISSLHWFSPRLGRGVSDFNVPRVGVIGATWKIPNVGSLSEPVAWIGNGWELGTIYKVSDGTPFTPSFGGDPLGQNSNDPWDFPNRLGGAGCSSLVHPGNPSHYIKSECFTVPTAASQSFYDTWCDRSFSFPVCLNLRGNAGRNILTGPGLSNLDFSITKNFPLKRISEAFNVQFRTELFNILNRTNFAVPTGSSTRLFDGTGAPLGSAGLLKQTATTARQVQFALKLAW